MRNRQNPRSLKRTSRGVTGRKGRALRVSEARHRRRYPKEALHDNEERFRLIAERSYDAITAINSEGRFTFVSPSVERIVGYRPEELAGVQFQNLVPESEMPKVVRAFNRMMKGENVEGLQLEVKRKDGTLVHIEVNGSPILKDGQVLGMQGILRDITEHKRAEEAIRRSEAKIRGVLDALPDLVFQVNSDGVFVDYHATPPEDLALTPEALLGKTMREIFPQIAEDALSAMAAAKRTGKIQTIECQLPRTNGKMAEYEARFAPTEVGDFLIVVRSITERKHADAALRESEAKYRALVEQSLQGILIAQGSPPRLVFANPTIAKIMGYTPDELTSLSPKETERLVHPEDRAVFFSHFRDSLQGKPVPPRYEVRGIRKDGEVRCLDFSSNWIEYQGQPAVQATFVDITERKRIENALQESEQRLRLVTDHMLDMIIRCDLRGNFEYVSPSHQMLGYEPKDLLGKSIFELIHPDDLERSVNAFLEGFQDRSPKTVEIRFKHADGHYVWIESVGNPIFDEKDEVSGAIIGSRDITERKQAEDNLKVYSERLEELVSERTKKLAESESRFRELADLLPEPVFEIDNEAKFTFVNRAGFALTGYTEEDMHSVNALDLVVPEDQERIADFIVRMLGGEKTHGNEYTAVRKDGSTFPVFLHGVRVMRGNDVVGLRAIAVDISERKQMEEQLLRSERLASIGETATMVGHDLRNPLQAMMGTLYLVKRLMAFEKAEDRKEAVGLLDTIDDQILYMDKIVSDLQDYARPVAADPVETSLPDLIRATVSSVKISGNVEVTVNVGVGLSNVKFDPVLFRRVLTNLILNAVQAMPKGGNVTVTAHKEQESVTVTVEDTGEGIARENMAKMFNPFFTTKAKGQGLGLAVCKRLVEAHNGTITVRSEVGKGSIFTLKIPTSKAVGAV